MGMSFKEWKKIQKENPKQYQKEYCTFMYNTKNEYNCDECPAASGRYINESGLLCGQQNCWVTCHCNSKD